MLRALAGFILLLTAGCAAPPLPKMKSHLPCCATAGDLDRLDGQRVMVDGIYRGTFVGKRPGDEERRRASGERPVLAGIETPAAFIMLGVYHEADARRPAEEIERLDGRHVVVYGTLRARTPVQRTAEGIEMATMTGPYLEKIDRVEVH